MKRAIITIFFLLNVSVIICGCNSIEYVEEPNINLDVTISKLTAEDYKSVGTSELENASKDDFRNIKIFLDIRHSENISNRKVIVPDIRKVADSNDRERYWFGQRYCQDNDGQNFAEYGYEFVFYFKGLNEEKIKEIFNLGEIIVSWDTEKGENKEKKFRLGQYIEYR